MLRLGLHLIGDSHTFEQLGEVNATCAAGRRVGIGDSFCIEQRLLEGIRRRNVRLGRALFYDHSHTGACKDSIGAGSGFAVFCERIETLLRQNHQICGFAGLHTFCEDGRSGPGEIELVAGCMLEFWRQLFQRSLHADGAEHFDFGAVYKPACAIKKTAIAARRLTILLMTFPLL